MTEFLSWRSYKTFRDEVRKNRRYHLSDDAQQFLSIVSESCRERVKDMAAGQILWRAQNGSDWSGPNQDDGSSIPIPYEFKRMKPRPDRATQGRANPHGIPCLYLAYDVNTAISEVRPWMGAFVSVARFATKRPLKLVDCSAGWSHIHRHEKEPSAEERKQAVWSNISYAFSEPVGREDDFADYAPTQIIAELFKAEGYDGIGYTSLLSSNNGINIALFDLEAAEPVECILHRVKKIRVQAPEATAEYIKAHSNPID